MSDLNEIKTTFEAFKGLIEQRDAEIKQFGASTQETKNAIDALNSKLDEQENALKALQTKLNRPAMGGEGGDAGQGTPEAKAAFLSWARKGALTPDEAKALSVSSDTAGGYLAQKGYVAEIIKTVTESSPVRQLATVRSTMQRAIQIPKRTGQFSAAWVAEQGTRSETTGLTFGQVDLPAHEMYALVDVSAQMLEDDAFNLEQFLAAEFAEQFAVAEGLAFISGNAVGKPEGILTNASVAETVSGSAAAITADGLIALYFDIKEAYAKNATWLMKRGTLKAVRQLKDGNNQYLWQPGLAGSAPATILDRPYMEATDMPAVAADAYPVAFGDFKKGYLIADRIQMEVTRDALTQATSGNIRFIARKRVGGQVVLAEAIRKLKCST